MILFFAVILWGVQATFAVGYAVPEAQRCSPPAGCTRAR